MKNLVSRSAAAALACAVALAAVQPAGAKAVSREGFAFPSDGTLKIAVFRPDVHVGSLKVGGLDEPNADWTEAARKNIQAAMAKAPELQGSDIEYVDELQGDGAQTLTQYRGLFELVAGEMFNHVTVGNNLLPTKIVETHPTDGSRSRKVSKIDWTLGDGAARLRDITGADYAMFVFTHDAYGDSGRKTAQVVGMLGCLIGACVIIPAGIHAGYSGMVDLRTGDVVWFNTDLAMGGDVRKEDGAEKRVGQLLAGFPARDLMADEQAGDAPQDEAEAQDQSDDREQGAAEQGGDE